MGFENYVDEPVMIEGIYRSKTGLNYTNLIFYEKKFFNERYVMSKKEWMLRNWQLSFLYALLYIALVFDGKAWMRGREKFDLRRALIAWNFVLAAFSIVGTVRVWPEFVYTLRTYGFEHSECINDYAHGVNGCWGWLFLLSKVPELIDTLFIVLRKQELIFLHWYVRKAGGGTRGKPEVAVNYSCIFFLYIYDKLRLHLSDHHPFLMK